MIRLLSLTAALALAPLSSALAQTPAPAPVSASAETAEARMEAAADAFEARMEAFGERAEAISEDESLSEADAAARPLVFRNMRNSRKLAEVHELDLGDLRSVDSFVSGIEDRGVDAVAHEEPAADHERREDGPADVDGLGGLRVVAVRDRDRNGVGTGE